MIHPPPGSFLRATELCRAELESRETAASGWILGWAAAGILTLGLHCALYLVLTRREAPPAAPQEMPAAVMINLAPIAVSARSEVDNVSEGPPATEAAQAAPPGAPPPPAPEPIVDMLPPPPNVTPQAALPPKPPKVEVRKLEKPFEKKDPPKKPVQQKVEKPKKPAETKDKRSHASRSAGGPRSDQHTADVTAAATAGSAVSQASRASWQNEIRAKIVRAKRYPPGASGATGVAVVSVTFGGSGAASGVRLVASSGNSALDAEAVAVMYRASPYPPPPGGQTTTLSVPMNFRR